MISIGPRVRKSPFFDATMRWGARAFTVYNHMYMPTHYGDPVEEYWRLVTDVTLWDVSCQRQIRIFGPDALPFIDEILLGLVAIILGRLKRKPKQED